MSTAVRLTPDGDLTEVEVPTGGSLKVTCNAIGCRLVDVVALTSKLDMWIDDEGMYTQEINYPATLIARRYGFVHQPYWGTVLFAGVSTAGDTTNLTADQFRALLTALDDITS